MQGIVIFLLNISESWACIFNFNFLKIDFVIARRKQCDKHCASSVVTSLAHLSLLAATKALSYFKQP